MGSNRYEIPIRFKAVIAMPICVYCIVANQR